VFVLWKIGFGLATKFLEKTIWDGLLSANWCNAQKAEFNFKFIYVYEFQEFVFVVWFNIHVKTIYWLVINPIITIRPLTIINFPRILELYYPDISQRWVVFLSSHIDYVFRPCSWLNRWQFSFVCFPRFSFSPFKTKPRYLPFSHNERLWIYSKRVKL